MRKAAILERLTIAILGLLLVAALVLAVRYDIERTAASKPRTAETPKLHEMSDARLVRYPERPAGNVVDPWQALAGC
jgi:hypothetical protein